MEKIDKIRILGRDRNVYVKTGKKYVNYLKNYILLSAARKMDKQMMKNKKMGGGPEIGIQEDDYDKQILENASIGYPWENTTTNDINDIISQSQPNSLKTTDIKNRVDVNEDGEITLSKVSIDENLAGNLAENIKNENNKKIYREGFSNEELVRVKKAVNIISTKCNKLNQVSPSCKDSPIKLKKTVGKGRGFRMYLVKASIGDNYAWIHIGGIWIKILLTVIAAAGCGCTVSGGKSKSKKD
jgi:hypothetical protein